MDKAFLFLIKLAWTCRYRLPLLITIGFMALDIRMQLEIHVQTRRMQGHQLIPSRGQHHQNEPRHRSNSEGSSSSWITIDEDETDDSEGVQDLLLVYSESEDESDLHQTTQLQNLRDVSVEN